MSLTDYPNPTSDKIKTWLADDADNDLKLGKGVMFYSTKQDGYDLSVLTARALILSGHTKFKTIDFNFCMEDDVLNELYYEKPPLLVLNFYPDSAFVEMDKYKKFETILNYYLDNCIPILLHVPSDKSGPLISPVFLDRITKNSKVFIV